MMNKREFYRYDSVKANSLDDVEIKKILKRRNKKVNEICQEFYSIEQSIEYLKVKFPAEYFSKIVLANLILKEKLELVVAFEEEIDLAQAWIKPVDGRKKNPLFREYLGRGTEYETNLFLRLHNPLSAFKLVVLSNGFIDIVRKFVTNLPIDFSIDTKNDVLLLREDKYWTVVDVAFGGDGDEIENSPKCFLDCATWGISAESLERYCSNLMVVTDDEPKDEKVKRWKKMRFEEKLKLHEIIEREHLKISISELQRLTGSKGSYATNKYKKF